MATYYVDMAVGDDLNFGMAEGAGNAWKTLDHAMDVVAAGDKVWCKASADYQETATIDTAGTATAPIVFEGYTSTTGDGGQITIDGQSVRANGIAASIVGSLFYVFKNVVCTGHTSHGFAFGASGDFVRCKNCRSHTNAGDGFSGDDQLGFARCRADNNSGSGIDIDLGGCLVACLITGNAVEGVRLQEGLVFDCLFYDLAAGEEAIIFESTLRPDFVVHCTIDGENGAATEGVQFAANAKAQQVVVNSIIYDCATGLISTDDEDEMGLLYNCLLNSNVADYSNVHTVVDAVSGAPAFIDEAGDDYRLAQNSPARQAALMLPGQTDTQRDIGALQSLDRGSVLIG